jgi:metallo-beta-lactamase class B
MRVRQFGIAFLLAFAEMVYGAQYAPANPEWNRPVEPFRVVGNVYYVGASGVCAYLIATPKGHILLDSGFRETLPLVEAGVRKLGFRIQDINLILISHAHYDHAAGIAELKARINARLLVNPIEAKQLAAGGRGDFAFGDSFPFQAVRHDGLLHDGQKIRLGDAVLTTLFTPGHTKGATTYTMQVHEGGRLLLVVFACSMTAPDYRLVDNPLYPEIAQDFQESFAKLRALPCDVFVTGHPWEFGMEAKMRALKAGNPGNPFIDPAGYQRWLKSAEDTFRYQLAAQRRPNAAPPAQDAPSISGSKMAPTQVQPRPRRPPFPR